MVRGILLSLALAVAAAPAAQAADITVFAAASLTDAMQAAGNAYQARTGTHVGFSFAASSTLARQIEASSGADIYVSADEKWMDELQAKGLIQTATRKDLLANDLVLIAPKDSKIEVTIRPHFDLAGLLGGGRLAVADPDSVPAGIYAKQALTNLGVWESVAPSLAPAENVRGALAYVARGETPLGIVYRTDALIEPAVKIVATFPASSHKPILYPIALTRDAQPAARGFLAFLFTPEAQAIFAHAGFTKPDSKP